MLSSSFEDVLFDATTFLKIDYAILSNLPSMKTNQTHTFLCTEFNLVSFTKQFYGSQSVLEKSSKNIKKNITLSQNNYCKITI